MEWRVTVYIYHLADGREAVLETEAAFDRAKARLAYLRAQGTLDEEAYRKRVEEVENFRRQWEERKQHSEAKVFVLRDPTYAEELEATYETTVYDPVQGVIRDERKRDDLLFQRCVKDEEGKPVDVRALPAGVARRLREEWEALTRGHWVELPFEN